MAILGLIYLAVSFAQRTMGASVAIVITVVVLLLLPASVAILGLEGNVFKAAYPVAWVRMALRLGPMYVLILAVIGGYSLTYRVAGKMGTLVTGANRDIYVFLLADFSTRYAGDPAIPAANALANHLGA